MKRYEIKFEYTLGFDEFGFEYLYATDKYDAECAFFAMFSSRSNIEIIYCREV